MNVFVAVPSAEVFLAFVLVLVVLCVLIGVVRSQLFTLVLLLLLFIPSYALRDQLDISVTFGGFRITALDALCAFILVLGSFRALTRERKSGLEFALLSLAFLLALHFVRGASAFGLQAATNSSRSWLYVLSCLIYAATVPRPWDRRCWHLVIVTGLALAAIALFYLGAEGIHSTTRRISVGGELVDPRPIVAGAALLVLQAAILLIATRWPNPSLSVFAAGFAVLGVVLTQHRTVWVGALAAAVVGAAIWFRQRRREIRTIVAGMGVAMLVIPVGIWVLAQSSTLRVSAGETTEKQSTFQWRIDSWSELIGKHHSLTDVLIGEPAGTSWSRIVFGEQTDVAAHSSFVEAFLRFGVAGPFLLLLLLVALFRRRARIARLTGLTSIAVTLLLLTQALFAVTYTLSAVEGVILGVFVSLLAWERQTAPQSSFEVARSQPHVTLAPG